VIFGCIEHRTWAFLRQEGDFDPVETADAITNLVYSGLASEQPASPIGDLVTRLEAATTRLETITAPATPSKPL
ncbi:hypothetical protein, partial [Bosea sp. (in: a-proteobacteria)]|uniref:hypothetical protein n=1 Tax=Bosea sp. (in: a-proteobacteria) TaxID=1871050 RepID=UPI002FCB9CD4